MLKNIIWEKKSIMLGIIFYLTKYHNNLKQDKIIIDNEMFRRIAKILFPDLRIKKKGDGFNINIRNNVKNGLIINNINNLDKIENKKIRLLPWYDKDNPIIMFVHDKTESNIDKKKKDLKEFSKYRRFVRRYLPNHVSLYCGDIWDSYTEYRILKRYSKKYSVAIEPVFYFISKILREHICDKKELRYVGIPIREQIIVPVKHNVPIIVKVPDKKSCDNYKNVITAVNKKINAVNNFY